MARKKYAQTETTILDWVEKHDSVRVWLSKLNGTKEQRALSLWYYCDWAEMEGFNGEELIAMLGLDRIFYEILDDKRYKPKD